MPIERQLVPAARRRHEVIEFLTERLKEELGQLWDRDRICPQRVRRPDLASQLEVLDDLLTVLAAGRLPEPHDLIVLMFAYRDHPDFRAEWAVAAK